MGHKRDDNKVKRKANSQEIGVNTKNENGSLETLTPVSDLEPEQPTTDNKPEDKEPEFIVTPTSNNAFKIERSPEREIFVAKLDTEEKKGICSQPGAGGPFTIHPGASVTLDFGYQNAYGMYGGYQHPANYRGGYGRPQFQNYCQTGNYYSGYGGCEGSGFRSVHYPPMGGARIYGGGTGHQQLSRNYENRRNNANLNDSTSHCYSTPSYYSYRGYC